MSILRISPHARFQLRGCGPMADGRRTILLVDSHPIVRAGLRELISERDDLAVLGEADDLSGALSLIDKQLPDLVILELPLRQGTGISLVRRIRRRRLKTKLLVFSKLPDEQFAERMLRLGAHGYVNKREPHETFLRAISDVLAGWIFFRTRALSRKTRHALRGSRPENSSPYDRMTNREWEIFWLLGQGLSPTEIASNLGLSPKTVEGIRDRMKAKFEAETSHELSVMAISHSLRGVF